VSFLPISPLSSARIPRIKGPWIHNVITIMATTHKKSVFLTKEDFGFGVGDWSWYVVGRKIYMSDQGAEREEER
jgi:hypothetical protein